MGDEACQMRWAIGMSGWDRWDGPWRMSNMPRGTRLGTSFGFGRRNTASAEHCAGHWEIAGRGGSWFRHAKAGQVVVNGSCGFARAKQCVTGASGFIASWLVKMLLERGYTVKGTIRNPEKAKHLLLLPGAPERLQPLRADLIEPGAFDSVVQGCEGVFHTASPVIHNNFVDPEAEILDPAVKGTLNVLESCSKVSGLKRVVIASSANAMTYTPERPSVVDESVWSDPEYNRNNKSWYALSKTLAEEAAWDFVKKHPDVDMVVINPSGVFGPVLQESLCSSNRLIQDILNGSFKVFSNRIAGVVGVKDVVMAHILAYEKPEAEGRYICNERVLHYGDLVSLLAKLYPDYPVVAKDADETTPRVPAYILNTEKLRKLGQTFEPLEDVIRETVTCYRDLKLLA